MFNQFNKTTEWINPFISREPIMRTAKNKSRQDFQFANFR